MIRTIRQWLGRFRRTSQPEDIPRKLEAAALAEAMEAARALHARHQVDVKPLSPGEIPITRRADSAD